MLRLWPLLAIALLGACERGSGGGTRPARHGRYAGIGVFEAGTLWSKMTGPNRAAAPQAATTADDEHIIVVIDSDSGDVRECGDLSGYCTTMNPWTLAIAPQQRAPVPLSAHAADLVREAEANANNTLAPPSR
jgi:hypothetical protein